MSVLFENLMWPLQLDRARAPLTAPRAMGTCRRHEIQTGFDQGPSWDHGGTEEPHYLFFLSLGFMVRICGEVYKVILKGVK